MRLCSQFERVNIGFLMPAEAVSVDQLKNFDLFLAFIAIDRHCSSAAAHASQLLKLVTHGAEGDIAA